MKNKIVYICALYVSLFLFSCSGPQTYRGFDGFSDNVQVINVKEGFDSDFDIRNVAIPAVDSIFFDYNKELRDIKLVELRGAKNCSVKNIDKLFISDDRIVIADFSVEGNVLIFDNTGKLIKCISKGTVISEINTMEFTFTDVAYYHDAKQILLHDDYNSVVYFFDNFGNYIRKEKAYMFFTDFANVKGSSEFLCYRNNGNAHLDSSNGVQVFFRDFEEKKIGSYYKSITGISEFSAKLSSLQAFSSLNQNGSILYSPGYSDTIFQFNPKNSTKGRKYVVDFPGQSINNLVQNGIIQYSQQCIDSLNTYRYFDFDKKVLVSDDSVLFINVRKGITYGFFVDTRMSPKFKVLGGIPKTSGADTLKLPLFFYPIATFNDFFISVIPGESFNNLTGNLSSEVIKIKERSNSNKNPVLIFYKLDKANANNVEYL